MTLTHLTNRAQALTLRLADAGVVVLYALMPFHAFLVIWLASLVGHQALLSIWKEAIILALVLMTLMVVILRRRFRTYLRADTWLIVGMIICGLVGSLTGAGLGMAFWVGVKTTALPLLLFLAVQLVASRFHDRRLALLILIPAGIVSVIALWQFVVIPTELLTRLGYNSTTIFPYQAVHPGFAFARSFATLGGPNQLGTYLILPATIALGYAVLTRERKGRILAALTYAVVLLATVTTFSRSALLGFLVASALVLILAAPKRWRWWIAGAMAGLLIIVAFTAWFVLTTQSSSEAGRFFLRGELTSTGVVGGDQGHIQSLNQGYQTIRQHPLGLGFGAAGPASQYGKQPLITENWFLQIGVELGLIGLVLMLVFLVHIGVEALRSRPHSPIHIATAATLAGVCVAGLFLHSLADSTLAITLMMTAGIVTARRRHTA